MSEFSVNVDKEYQLNVVSVPDTDNIEFNVTFIVDPQMANKIKSNYMKARRKNIELNGFRKGKAPIGLIEKRMGGIKAVYASSFVIYANAKIMENSPNKVIHTYNMNAEEQEDKSWIVTFGASIEPSVNIRDEDLEFKFEIPAFDLDNYVDHRIATFSHTNPYLRMKEDDDGNFLPAEKGDMVEISIEAFIDDKIFEAGSHESIDIRLIPEEINPRSLYEKLLGSMPKDSFVITVTNPEEIPSLFQKDFRGKSKFEMRVVVKYVYKCMEPEIDDDLAITAGYDNLDEWKKNLYTSAQRTSESYEEQLKRSLVLDHIMSNIPYPDFSDVWAGSHADDILKNEKYSDLLPNKKLEVRDILKVDLKKIAKQYTLLKQIGNFLNIEWDEEDQNKSMYDKNEQRYAESVLSYLIKEKAEFTYVDTKTASDSGESGTDRTEKSEGEGSTSSDREELG